MGMISDLSQVIAPVIERVYGGSATGVGADVARAVVASSYVVPRAALTEEAARAERAVAAYDKMLADMTALAAQFEKNSQNEMEFHEYYREALHEAAAQIKAVLG